MANKDDYLTDYRCFFERFAQTVNPNDQLPVKLGSYKFVGVEVVGGIIDWTTQYLTQKQCPQSLLAPLIKIVIDEARKLCKKQPVLCGFNPSDNAYEPLKLMQTVMKVTNEVCLRYMDNSKLCSLPTPGPPYNAISACAVKNSRRRMEDRHVIIHDLNTLFSEQETSPSSYYAIFDGHAGHDAAAYSCAHLHQFLAESPHFIPNPKQALRDAFIKTDTFFLDKCKVENFSSGTTAVCALHRPKEKLLYIAWVGDSQAVLVSPDDVVQCVRPHKPCREDEKQRIENSGGIVMFWGTWRVNGQLAVSRAIGDSEYKPYVTAVPDVVEIALSGKEDFLILACDGLWDFLSETDAAHCVYDSLARSPDDLEAVSQRLVQLSKQEGSSDNISVIVVFLREPDKISAEAQRAGYFAMDNATIDNANTESAAATNPFLVSNSLFQKENFLNLADGFKQNGGDFCSNGKRSADVFDDEDLGPETDVDAVDDALRSPSEELSAGKKLFDEFDPFKEKASREVELQKQDEEIVNARDETPTPPVDSVHETGGLVDNVADSEGDSDDEWNYFKGDTADKENVPPSREDQISEEERASSAEDRMSQLNPNAAEFVPVASPKRDSASPFAHMADDSVIAQSPRRDLNNDVDISVPTLQDFEREVKSRPSELQDSLNDDSADDDNKPTSQELMESLLNGKSIDEIEFQPTTSPVKAKEEFHFGPNSTFSTPGNRLDQSESLSTKAVFGDESSASYLEDKGIDSFINNESVVKEKDDSMSLSFYQEKDTDPLDLNKVHVLPENVDEFIEESEDRLLLNDTISDLPEHNPLHGFIEKGKEATTDIINASDLILQEVKEALKEEAPPSPAPLSPAACSPAPPQSPVPSTLSVESPVPSHYPLLDLQFEAIPEVSSVNESPLPSRDLESPVEDITSSVKDSPLAASPVDGKPDVENLHIDDIVEKGAEDVLIPESCSISTPKSLVDTESVATTEVNSFLDRSSVPDITSPLSPNKINLSDNLVDVFASNIDVDTSSQLAFPGQTQRLECSLPPPTVMNVEVKSEIIEPLFAEPSLATPSEESRAEDISNKEETVAPEIVAVATGAAVAAAVAVVAETKSATLKTKTTPTAKKPTSKAASIPKVPPTKTTPTAAKPGALASPKSATARTSLTATKTTATRLKSASTATTAAGRALPEKKPEVKANGIIGPKRTPLTGSPRPTAAKPATSAITKTTTSTLTKPTAATTLRQAAARPTNLTKSTTVTRTATTASSVKAAPKTATSLSSPKTATAAAPKPRPTTAPAPRTRPTTASRTLPKAPDTEKQIKETTNKQITASARSTTARTIGSTTSRTTVQKTEPRTIGSRTVTKTTSASAKLEMKKPTELVRQPASKTKSAPPPPIRKAAAQPKQNGLANGVKSAVKPIDEPQLVKDSSPIVDNSLIDSVQLTEGKVAAD